jgi:protein-disulfide isomerase
LPLLEQVLKQYPENVKLVFKNFPLRNHKQAKPAATAAWAAGQQGKFWEMHDIIFANYSKLSDAKYKEFAQQIGLNMAQFEKDLLDPDVAKMIQSDIRNGAEAGVRGTPTLFVNGRRLKNRSLAGFKQVIDAELKKAKK